MITEAKNNKIDTLLGGLMASLFFFLPYERIPTLEVGGYTVKISYGIGLLLLLLVAANPRIRSIVRSHPLTRSDKWLIAFWAIGAISIITSHDAKRSVVVTLMWAFVFGLYLILNRLLRDAALRAKLKTVTIYSALLVSLFGIYQFWGDLWGLPMSATGLRFLYTKAIFGFPRIQSVGLEPLYFGNYLLVPFFLTLYYYIKDTKLFNKYWLIGLIIAINLVLGIARSIYISVICTSVLLLLFLVLKKDNRILLRKKALGLLMLAAMAIGTSLGFIHLAKGPQATEAFVGHAMVNDVKVSTSIPGRLETYKFALDQFIQHPLLGVGIGAFGAVIAYAPGEAIQYGATMVVNNEYLEIATETGVFGLLAFGVFIVLVLREYAQAYRCGSLRDRISLFLLFLGLLAIFIQYNFFSTLYIIYVWVFLALFMAEVRTVKDNNWEDR